VGDGAGAGRRGAGGCGGVKCTLLRGGAVVSGSVGGPSAFRFRRTPAPAVRETEGARGKGWRGGEGEMEGVGADGVDEREERVEKVERLESVGEAGEAGAALARARR